MSSKRESTNSKTSVRNTPTFYNQTTNQTFLQRIVVPTSTNTTLKTSKQRLNTKTNPNHNSLERLCRAFSNNKETKQNKKKKTNSLPPNSLIFTNTKPLPQLLEPTICKQLQEQKEAAIQHAKPQCTTHITTQIKKPDQTSKL